MNYQNLQKTNIMPFKTLEEATGPIPYNMTNDYMFRAVLQKNNKVLRGLIGSLLHLSEEEMVSVTITNPIVIGEAISDKEFRLDINVELNNKKLINLEMQIVDYSDWEDRSLSYLCRSFDQLNHGQAYNETKAVIHIGFLDYTLFKEYPEFYADYRMMNEKNHYIFSDKFILRVLDLTHIELATDEDKQYHIDHWAKLFKAQTWEELKSLSANDSNLQEATKSIFTMTADQLVQKRCRDREEYYATINYMQNKISSQEEAISSQKETIASQEVVIANQQAKIEALQAQIAELKK